MSFLSLYSGTEKVDVGNGYWIEIKQCLSRDEKGAADSLLEKAVAEAGDDGKMHTRVTPDMSNYQNRMVFASVLDWNLDDDNGQVWQLSPDSAKWRNVKRLPSSVFDKVYKRVNELNKEPSSEDTKSTAAEPGTSDPERDAIPGDPDPVPDGAAVVEAPRGGPGVIGQAPVA